MGLVEKERIVVSISKMGKLLSQLSKVGGIEKAIMAEGRADVDDGYIALGEYVGGLSSERVGNGPERVGRN